MGFIPVAKPFIGEEEKKEVIGVLESGWISVGPECRKLEEGIAKYTGAGSAVALNSCTAGLFLALKAMGIGKGDEVIVPTYTFCSSVNVVEHLGAKPVFVDSEPNTMNMDMNKLRESITDRTKAIMPVHFAGQPVDLDRLLKAAREIPVVEDAAHAIGAEFKGRKVGTFGAAGVFSFYATKNMTTGDGGALVTDNDGLAENARTLRLHGLSKDAWKRYDESGSWRYDVVDAGYKFNMTDIQAALGVAQLRKLNGFNARRREIAGRYRELLKDVEVLELPEEKPDRTHIYHLFPVFVRKGLDRDDFVSTLRKEEIGTSVHFIPVHSFTYYRKKYGFREDDFPVAWEYFNREVSLPMFNGMTDSQVKQVAIAIKKAVDA